MRARGVVGVSALVLAGVVTAAASAGGVFDTPGASAPEPVARNTAHVTDPGPTTAPPEGQAAMIPTVGIVPSAPRPERQLRTADQIPSVAPAVAPDVVPSAPRSVPVPVVVGPLGIPEIVLNAYRAAELTMASTQPSCGLPWHLLAGIGKIESNHAGGGQTDAAGTTVTPILGPVLNGHLAGNEIITDTDGGLLDGDATHDRAVGPMQFIPSTWARYASDGNGDGVANPNNVFDATLAAARYLCSGGLDLRDPSQEARAVLRYNNSTTYMGNVLAWSVAYRSGGTAAPAVPVVPAPPQRSSDSEMDVAAPLPSETPAQSSLPSAPEAVPAPAPEAVPAPAPEAVPAPAPMPQLRLPEIPGLPELPCLVFCPPAPAPTAP
ncbi:lytic transglycosylase domain-containing protein [Prescottella sp. R16]|uniref:lytic transglycosylase domain-containing protein n=1 Tax=Prescottella sp. R16 TaxID=3064529 RepID=UPI00272E1471|nr:lytic murein transglycosylase [Prescottella sp. R16]